MTDFRTIESTLFELLELSRANYLALLKQENPDQEAIASCQMSIQYYLGEITKIQKAQKPGFNIGQFFRSIFFRIPQQRISEAA